MKKNKKHLVKIIILFVTLVTAGAIGAWGQVNGTGIYYIANNNDKSPYYNPKDNTKNYYLVPASNGGDSNVAIADWAWNNDSNTPFVTTYQTEQGNNSIWVVEVSGSYYHLIHLLTGKYMTLNAGVASNSSRRTFHMADSAAHKVSQAAEDSTLFQFTEHDADPKYYSINPKLKNSGYKYVNPSKANQDKYYGTTTESGYAVGGLIGLYNQGADNNLGSKWFFESASQLQAPTLTMDNTTNVVTVTETNGLPSGYKFRYTFGDGTQADPTATSTEVPAGGFTVTEKGTLKVVVERYGVVLTQTASLEVTPVVLNPTITLTPSEFTYDGTEKRPAVTVMDGATTINPNEYEVSYSNNINAGTATVTITDNEGGDYIINGTATFTINKASYTPTVTMADWVYGTSPSTPSLSGVPAEVSSITYQYKVRDADDETYVTYTPNVTQLSVGTYTLRANFAESANYNAATATADFAVTKTSINPTVTIEGWSYGETPTTPVVTGNLGNGAVTYDYKVKDASDDTYQSYPPQETLSVGSYTLRATIAETENYAGATAYADFTVSKTAITPTVTIAGWTYGETASTPEVYGNTGNGAVTFHYKKENEADAAYKPYPPQGSQLSAGTYTLRATIAETQDYSGATATTTFSVSKASYTLTVTMADWVFDAEPSTPSVEGVPSEVSSTQGYTVYYAYKVKGADDNTYSSTKPSAIGEYTIRAYIDATTNYYAATATADFAITKKPFTPTVTITGWTYGETPNTPTVDGNTSGGAVTFDYKRKNESDETYTPYTAHQTQESIDAGDYTLRATIAETADYAEMTATADFTVAKATMSPAPTVTIDGWAYGETPSSPVVTGNTAGGAVTFEYKGSAEDDEAYQPYTAQESQLPAGSYILRATIAESTNYNGATATANFTVAKGTYTLTVTIDNWVSGDTAPTPSVSGVPEEVSSAQGYTVTYAYKVRGADDNTYTTTVPTTPGDYTLRATIAATTNYESVSATDDFTVLEPATTVATPTITYAEGKATIETVTEGATIYYTTDGTNPTTGSTQYTDPFNVADQTTIKAIAIKDGLADSPIASAKLVLHPTITLTIPDGGYTYDGNAKEPAVSSVKDGATTIDASEYTVTYADNTDAGENTAAVVITDNPGGTYLVYGTATFSISQADITPSVTLDDWGYGGTPSTPEVTGNMGDGVVSFYYKVKGAADATYKSYDPTANHFPTAVGEYTLRVNIAATTNYKSATATTDFQITKGTYDFTVTIDNWEYEATASTPSVSGVPEEVSSVPGYVTYDYKVKDADDNTYTSTVPTAIGEYTLRATIAATDNYNEVTATTDFAITKKSYTLAVSIAGWTYGETPATPSVSDVPSVVSSDPGYTVTYEYKKRTADDSTYKTYDSSVTIDAGDYTLRATIAETADYAAMTATANFTVAKATMSPAPTVTIAGWAYGVTPSTPVVTNNTAGGAVTFEYKESAEADEAYRPYETSDVIAVGTYTLRATIAATTNYNGATATASFTVTQGTYPLTVFIGNWIFGNTVSTPSVDHVPEEVSSAQGYTVTYEYKVKDADDNTYVSYDPNESHYPVNAGDYTLRASIAATSNYNAVSATTDFKILQASIQPTVTIESWTYGDTPSTPEVTGNTGSGAVTYDYKGKNEADTEYVTYESPASIAPGTYTLLATIAATTNYKGATATADFTVSKKSMNALAVSIAGWTYGGTPSTPSVSGVPNEVSSAQDYTVTYEYKGSAEDDTAYRIYKTYTAQEPHSLIDAGTYTLRATIAETDHYQGGSCITNFTISPTAIGDGTNPANGIAVNFKRENDGSYTIMLKLGDETLEEGDSDDYTITRTEDDKYIYFTVTGTGYNFTAGSSFTMTYAKVRFTKPDGSGTPGGTGTFVADADHATPANMGAYIVSRVEGNMVITEPLDYIPEGVPVLLLSTVEADGFVVKPKESGTVTDAQKNRNQLQVVTETTEGYNATTQSVHFDTGTIYLLYKGDFVLNMAGDLAKGRVYLPKPESGGSGARLSILWTEGVATDIGQHPSSVTCHPDKWYTLDGRELDRKPTKRGLYLRGSQKVVVR